jgi:hypothetical protein
LEECRPSPNLERLGGKAPKAYIEEARAKKGIKVDESEVTPSLKLAKAKPQADCQGDSRGRVDRTKKMSDKVSGFWWEMLVFYANWPRFRWKAPTSLFTQLSSSYLSTDCIKGTPDFVLGRIVYQEELVAGRLGTDANHTASTSAPILGLDSGGSSFQI